MELVDAIQSFVAVVAIGPSTVRGLKVKGVAKAARDYLSSVNLKRFATGNGQSFRAELDKATQELKAICPKGAQCWGVARKCLNIFLRDAFYNFCLREQFGLIRAEKFYEVPLDSIVAKALRENTVGLPRWPGVKHLTAGTSNDYQQAAAQLAAQRKIERVHLDTYLWIEGR
jgi:hypothetical protein